MKRPCLFRIMIRGEAGVLLLQDGPTRDSKCNGAALTSFVPDGVSSETRFLARL